MLHCPHSSQEYLVITRFGGFDREQRYLSEGFCIYRRYSEFHDFFTMMKRKYKSTLKSHGITLPKKTLFQFSARKDKVAHCLFVVQFSRSLGLLRYKRVGVILNCGAKLVADCCFVFNHPAWLFWLAVESYKLTAHTCTVPILLCSSH